MNTKTCFRCGVPKPLEAFGSAKYNADGLSSWCRDCYHEYDRQRKFTPKAQAKKEARRLQRQEELEKKKQNLACLTEKVCTKCGELKLIGEFGVCSRVQLGRAAQCRACANTQARIRCSNPKVKAKHHQYYLQCRAKTEAYSAQSQKEKIEKSQQLFLLKEKRCPHCKILKTVGDFGQNTQLPSGYEIWCSVCRQAYAGLYEQSIKRSLARMAYKSQSSAQKLKCSSVHGREALHAKQEWINSLKAGPCTDCGKILPPCCMDFDHAPGTKVKGIGVMLGCKEDRVLAEIAKCELVCACCHRVRTRKQRAVTKCMRRKLYLERINQLKAVPCIDCGQYYPPEAMDFDHVWGEKIATISQLRSAPWDKALAEIAKCELVCANCHRIRTQARRVKKPIEVQSQSSPSNEKMAAQ